MSNLWVKGEAKEYMPGVHYWENSIEVPDGIIEHMNKEVDDWKVNITQDMAENNEIYKQGIFHNGPIRFNPEFNFKTEESITYFKQTVLNTMDKVAQYCELYPDAKLEINWMEPWQYITYIPPKNMTYHSDNHSVRNQQTGMHDLGPYLRRFTVLTYLNDDYKGGALKYRYFDLPPFKPKAGTVLIQPSNYMWSHATTPLLNGRKAAFLVAVSSHYDVSSEEYGAKPEDIIRRELR